MTSGPRSKPPRTWQVGTLTYTRGGLARLFLWLLGGDFSCALRDRAVGPVLQLLFRRFGASDMTTGLIFSSLPNALGMILNPIVSYQSDRLRTRWGRRIPFLLVPLPFSVLSLAGLAFGPQFGAGLDHALGSFSPGLNGCTVLAMGAAWTIYDIANVIMGSVFGGLVNDVVPGEIVGRFFGLFRAVSLFAGILFFFDVKDGAETHYTWILLGVAAFYGIGGALVCLFVKEGTYPPPPASSGGPGVFRAVKTYFRESFGNSYYLWFFAAGALGITANLPFNMFALFYAKALGMDLDVYFKLLALTYVISLVLSYPLGALADRVHPLRLSAGAIALYAVVMALGWFLVRDRWSFAIALVAHGVIVGSYVTASSSLGQRMLPRDRFAEIASAGGIVSSVASLLLAPLFGSFLDFMHHEYRYTFLGGVVLSLAALGAFLVLYRQFLGLGGPDHYAAPEPGTKS